MDAKSIYVDVELENGEKTQIEKTTVVWLFQETERVSSDRFLRVRSRQPTEQTINNYTKPNIDKIYTHETDHHPQKVSHITVGDLCAFLSSTN